MNERVRKVLSSHKGSVEDSDQIDLLIRIGKELYRRGLTSSTGGNISVRCGDRVYITRSRSSLGFLKREDILEVSAKDGSYRGNGRPSSELPLHLGIYRSMDVLAIIHAHPPFSIAYLKEGMKISPVGTEGRMILRNFKVLPGEGFNIVNVDEVVEALKECPITFVSNHGSVAVGRSLLEAFELTDLLESEIKVLTLRKLLAAGL